MYAIINANAAFIAGSIPVRFINRYNSLRSSLSTTNVSTALTYQKSYRGFWKLRFPHVGYCTAYFTHLEREKNNPLISPYAVCVALTHVSIGLQFSFATKFVHMANPHTPVYDEMVRQFYCLPKAPSKSPYMNKLAHYMTSYNFLIAEYQRIITNHLLDPAIAAFRRRFPSAATHTDERVIDWLVWQFVNLANDGHFRTGPFQHS